MAIYHNSKQTNCGRVLENRARNGEGTIEFTCIRAGSGTYTDDEKLTLNNATSLKETRQEFPFTGITPKKENDYLSLESIITNEGVQEGYYLSELGIYARLKGTTEDILYCIGLVDYPDYVPSSEHERYEIILQSLIKCYHAADVTIEYEENTYATAEALHRHITDKDNPHGITDKTDGIYRQATGYTDQAIADLINAAPSTLDTLGEIAQAMLENNDVVDALEAAVGTKASQAELDGHIGNSTIHITVSERQAWNGKQTMTGDTKDNTVTFTSGDNANPTNWGNVGQITSGEKQSSLWNKVSLFAKNVRYLWKLMGNTSLSNIGNGTVTGAISALNTSLSKVGQQISTGTPAKTIPPQTDVEIGSITLPSGFWIIYISIWYGPYFKSLRINGFQILNEDHKPEMIAFYSGQGDTLPLITYTWETSNIEINEGSITAFRIK